MISGLLTLAAMLCFAGVVWWAYAPSRRKRFEDAANLPLTDEPPAPIEGARR